MGYVVVKIIGRKTFDSIHIGIIINSNMYIEMFLTLKNVIKNNKSYILDCNLLFF